MIETTTCIVKAVFWIWLITETKAYPVGCQAVKSRIRHLSRTKAVFRKQNRVSQERTTLFFQAAPYAYKED